MRGTILLGAAATAIMVSSAMAVPTVVMSDNFSDGDRTANPAWYVARSTSSQTTSVVNDPTLGGGFALQQDITTTSLRLLTTEFPSVSLADGESLSVTLDFRIITTPLPSADRKFRFGIYRTNGTSTTADYSGAASLAPVNNDDGYYAQIDVQDSGNSLSVFYDPAPADPTTDTVLGGSGVGIGLTSADEGFRIVDNAKHTATLTLARSGADLLVSYQQDSTLVDNGLHANAPGFSFDSFDIGVNGVAMGYAFDNISVVYNTVPEPASLSLLAVGGLLAMRRRH